MRKGIEAARDELLRIPLEVMETHLDRAYDMISRVVGDPK